MGAAWMSPGVCGSWLTGAYGRGMRLPRRPTKQSIAVLCGDVKETFGVIWFALQCGTAKQCTMLCDHDHIPVSRGCMRVQYPLLMAKKRLLQRLITRL